MKTKHNKKRNTVFLYEILIKELAKNIVKKNNEKKNIILSILKEHFRKDSVLYKERYLYEDILESKKLDFHTAEKILHESKKVYFSDLNRDEIYKEQSSVITKINKNLSKNVFSNFISNYKDLATLSQIFGDDLTVKKRIMLERGIIQKMMTEEEIDAQKMKPIDNLVYKTFIDKFNSTYGCLLEEQRKLLTQYIFSLADEEVEFKLFLNEEVGRLKEAIDNSLGMQEVKSDSTMLEKTKKVLNLLESYGDQKIDDNMIKSVLKVQELAKEISTDG